MIDSAKRNDTEDDNISMSSYDKQQKKATRTIIVSKDPSESAYHAQNSPMYRTPSTHISFACCRSSFRKPEKLW